MENADAQTAGATAAAAQNQRIEDYQRRDRPEHRLLPAAVRGVGSRRSHGWLALAGVFRHDALVPVPQDVADRHSQCRLSIPLAGLRQHRHGAAGRIDPDDPRALRARYSCCCWRRPGFCCRCTPTRLYYRHIGNVIDKMPRVYAQDPAKKACAARARRRHGGGRHGRRHGRTRHFLPLHHRGPRGHRDSRLPGLHDPRAGLRGAEPRRARQGGNRGLLGPERNAGPNRRTSPAPARSESMFPRWLWNREA